MAAHSGSLTRVAVYRRSVQASLERVWENVLDWEHLPWLHRTSFSAIECQDAGDWGWRARVALQPVEPARDFLLELTIERAARRYVARTLEGTGKGSEIWTQLDVLGPRCTGVEVEFHVPGVPEGSRSALGAMYRALYRSLWDEDEAMMMRRDAPRPGAVPSGIAPLGLGPLATLRPRLPLQVEYAGRSFRLLELGGELRIHTTECPHWRGPLEAAEPSDDCIITCPWHGYRFDLRSGCSSDGRGLRLAPAPRVRVDPESSEVWIAWR
jgi:nitrite reductase/ring-hydroxylating ferredoxin subunit